jgi:hypothetical protein
MERSRFLQAGVHEILCHPVFDLYPRIVPSVGSIQLLGPMGTGIQMGNPIPLEQIETS